MKKCHDGVECPFTPRCTNCCRALIEPRPTISDADLVSQREGWAKSCVTTDANPKDIAGRAKPQLHLIPSPALIEVAKVMGNGAFKYGPYNWREKPVCHTAYISAAERHERSHLDGELMDSDAATPHPVKGAPPNPQVYHLAAAAAGLLILLDAILTGNAIDDRPKGGVAGALINPSKPTAEPNYSSVRMIMAPPREREPGCRCPAYCQQHSPIKWGP